MTNKFEELKVDTITKEQRKKFLDSLHFPELNQRQEEIKDAYKKTFRWIFDQSGEAVRPWSNFIDWLANGSGTYWINGKPGSGKSTLMSYICQDSRTKSALSEWVGQKQLLMPTFFFWAAGSGLQHSIVGLLRSLIYQILSQDFGLLIRSEYRNTSSQKNLPKRSFLQEPSTVWTERKIMDLLLNLVENSSQSHCLCLFIDGLDELQGDRSELIQFITSISQQKHVKCCLSSRPERPFQKLGPEYRLRLQDLTRPDIVEYVSFRLGEFVQILSLPPDLRATKKSLIDDLVAKADGVFLWVELAIRSQILGIDSEDSFELLRQRLDKMPTEIEGLYQNMLMRIDPIHHTEAAVYLRNTIFLTEPDLVIYDRRSNVFHHSIARYSLTSNMRLKHTLLDTKTLVSECAYTNNRINAICAGFLEISIFSDDDGPISCIRRKQHSAHEESSRINWSRQKVSFCHRTALDFFRDPDGDVRRFLTSNIEYRPDVELFDAHLFGTVLYLAQMNLCKAANHTTDVSGVLWYLMIDLRGAEKSMPEDAKILREYLEHANYVDSIIGRFDKKFNNPSDQDHWCVRWPSQETLVFQPSRTQEMMGINLLSCSEAEEYLPNSFLNVAALYKLYRYVQGSLDTTGTRLSTEEANRLAVSNIMDYRQAGQAVKFQVQLFSQLRTITTLIKLGADPNAGPRGHSILQSMLRFIYAYKTGHFREWGRLPPSRQECNHLIAEAMKALLDTGVNLNGCITTGLDTIGVMRVFLECQTSLAPPPHCLLEDQDSTSLLKYQKALKPPLVATRPSKVLFHNTAFGDRWPDGGQL